MDEKTKEGTRSFVTCPRSHGQRVAELRLACSCLTVEHAALTIVLCILSVLQMLAIHLLPGGHNWKELQVHMVLPLHLQ